MSEGRASPEDGGALSGLGMAGTASAGVGAALAAALASACCVGPVVAPLMVAVLGASGAAWAASLEPYSPFILAGSGLLIAYSFRVLYGPSRGACDPGETAGPGWKERLLVAVVWGAGLLWVVSLGLNLFLSKG